MTIRSDFDTIEAFARTKMSNEIAERTDRNDTLFLLGWYCIRNLRLEKPLIRELLGERNYLFEDPLSERKLDQIVSYLKPWNGAAKGVDRKMLARIGIHAWLALVEADT